MADLVWLLVLLVGAPLGLVVFGYNRLATLSRRCEQAFSDIDVQLKHRHDVLPSLVETVRSFTGHERGMIEAVLAARTEAARAQAPEARLSAEARLTSSIVTLMASVEANPQLQSSAHYADLRREIVDVNNKITAARRFHNLAVGEYNAALDRFPGNLIGRRLGMAERRSYDLGLERVFVEDAPALNL